jgi:FkbM family methyltransferase
MLPGLIRRFSCSPTVRAFARRLGITEFARNLYCSLLARNGELQISCLGVNAVFKGRDSKQLAFVDYIFTTEKDAIEAALSPLKPGDTFLDVGSHYGTYAVLASKLVGPTGKVIAVEPHPESLEILRENLAVNRCENVEVLDYAFSDTTTPLALAYNKYCAGPVRESDPDSVVHTTQGMAGDEALRNAATPAAVKIDVEGHEFAVLSGLKRTLSTASCRSLCLEVHPSLLPSGITQESIIEFIRKCGLTVLSESARSQDFHVVATR